MKNLAQVFLSLSREDFSILKAIEAGMRSHEWVPLEEISQSSGLSLSKVEYRFRHLADLKLVFFSSCQYQGCKIDFRAYDLLALRDLVDHKAVLSLGEKVGVGKESVVYEALGEIPLIIKFHRAGRTSFKHIRRSRYHLADRPRASWLYAAKLAASREFQVLERLHPQVSVPIPVGHSRNAVAMGLVDGVRLDRAVLEDPRGYLEEVLREVGGAWRLGLVHADLSEFNIFVHDRGITIIDWPQAVETDQNSSMRLLERDLRNILHFFSRRYKLELPLDQAISLVVPGAKVALLTQGVRS